MIVADKTSSVFRRGEPRGRSASAADAWIYSASRMQRNRTSLKIRLPPQHAGACRCKRIRVYANTSRARVSAASARGKDAFPRNAEEKEATRNNLQIAELC